MADWLLALLTTLVWGTTYGLYLMRDAAFRRSVRLHAWRLRHRLMSRRHGPRAVPSAITRPIVTPFPPPRRVPAVARGRAAVAHKVEVAEPAPRIAEWRVDNLPLRYRLLGRARRGANDN